MRVIVLTFILLGFKIAGISTSCDKSILPELTFRLGGNNLEWPCVSTRNIYSTTGRYIPKHIIATRSQIYRDEAYVALPRYRPGVPFTLGVVNLKRGQCSVQVKPFPCWSLQEEGNCQALQNVVDLFLDNQDILWALDTGIVNNLVQPTKRCPPKVVAIDVKSGRVVKIIDLSKLTTSASRLQYLVVDYDSVGRAYVYVADAGSRAILVHNCTDNKSHRIVLPNAVVSGSNRNDVLYMALIRKSDSSNHLYFTYLGAPRLFSIKTQLLRVGLGAGAVVDVGPKPNGLPIVILGTDNGSSLFLRYKGQSDIFLWSTETCFKSSNFIEAQKGDECRLPTQVMSGHKRFMWTIESNFNDFISNKMGCNGVSTLIHPVAKENDS